jgi:hypothetical protein
MTDAFDCARELQHIMDTRYDHAQDSTRADDARELVLR